MTWVCTAMRIWSGLPWAWARAVTTPARRIAASNALYRISYRGEPSEGSPLPLLMALNRRAFPSRVRRGCQAARRCYDPGRRFAMAAIETSRNMRLLAQHDLNGFGNVGEG